MHLGENRTVKKNYILEDPKKLIVSTNRELRSINTNAKEYVNKYNTHRAELERLSLAMNELKKVSGMDVQLDLQRLFEVYINVKKNSDMIERELKALKNRLGDLGVMSAMVGESLVAPLADKEKRIAGQQEIGVRMGRESGLARNIKALIDEFGDSVSDLEQKFNKLSDKVGAGLSIDSKLELDKKIGMSEIIGNALHKKKVAMSGLGENPSVGASSDMSSIILKLACIGAVCYVVKTCIIDK